MKKLKEAGTILLAGELVSPCGGKSATTCSTRCFRQNNYLEDVVCLI